MPFKPGDPNINRNGRPKQPEIQELRDALDAAKKDKNKSILEHFVERAYTDDGVLVALVKKMLPDKNHLEAEINAEVTMMPTIEKDGKPLEYNVGD